MFRTRAAYWSWRCSSKATAGPFESFAGDASVAHHATWICWVDLNLSKTNGDTIGILGFEGDFFNFPTLGHPLIWSNLGIYSDMFFHKILAPFYQRFFIQGEGSSLGVSWSTPGSTISCSTALAQKCSCRSILVNPGPKFHDVSRTGETPWLLC